MERSSFFNSIGGDRRRKAEDWAEYFSAFIGNGVFPLPSDSVQVIAGQGMTIVLKPGKAWINGYIYINDDDLIIPLATADGVLRRIDRVVLRWDLTDRTITARIKSSPPSSVPNPVALQRDADAYEICLADIMVNNGIVQITQGNITDQRLNGNLCGVVAGVVQQIDTNAFNAQLQAWFTEYRLLSLAEYETLVSYFNARRLQSDTEYNSLIEWFNSFKASADSTFNNWFNTLQDILDENAATHILSMLLNLVDRVMLIEAVIFNDIYTNPFIIQFDDLDGVFVTGVWNANLRRMEC